MTPPYLSGVIVSKSGFFAISAQPFRYHGCADSFFNNPLISKGFSRFPGKRKPPWEQFHDGLKLFYGFLNLNWLTNRSIWGESFNLNPLVYIIDLLGAHTFPKWDSSSGRITILMIVHLCGVCFFFGWSTRSLLWRTSTAIRNRNR